MVVSNRILVLASSNMLLYCSALAELLSQKGFHVDITEEESFGASSGALRNRHCLAISFAGHALALPASRIAALCGKDTKRLLVLNSDDKLSMRLLANLDVDGIFFSGAGYPELLAAIHTVVNRNLKYISPALIATFIGPEAHNPLSSLSRKEMDIALILAKGKRNFQIAAELNISPKTVNTYKARIYKKLGISNDMQLLKLTLQGDSAAALN